MKSRLRKYKREIPLHIMLIPAVILLLVYRYLPMVGISIAFQDYVPSKGFGFFSSEWVGWENFQYIFSMPDFTKVIRNTLVIAVAKIVTGILVPLVIALLLNEVRNAYFKKSVQTILYIPYFLSWVILSGILIDILDPSTGFVNTILGRMGHDPIYFLGSNSYFRSILVSSEIWKNAGYNTIIYLAAIVGIQQSQYEAAYVDGAGRWKQAIFITLPSMKPIIVLLTVLSMGNVLNAGFDQVMNLYNKLVYETGDILDTYVYRLGMEQLQYSVATAVGLFKSVVSFVLISSGYYVAKKYADYRLF